LPEDEIVRVGGRVQVVLQTISFHTRYLGGGMFFATTNCGQNIFCNTTLHGERRLSRQSFTTAWAARHNLVILVER
jgi:hypothetical protein